jgi:uncharacterized protein (DUF1800 family)
MTFNGYRLMKTSSTFLAHALCGIVLVLPALAKPKTAKPANDSKLFQKKLPKDVQILHALDRLTFGPRPGDVERVKKIGLQKWLFQQLHPDRMPENPVLEAQIQALESLRMTPLEALQHYPGQQMIRAIASGKQPMPDDLLLRASIERLITRYKVKRAQAAGLAAPAADANTELEPIRALDEVLTPAELETVRGSNADKKRELLESMQQDRVEDMLIAMNQRQRTQLFSVAPSPIRREIFLFNGPQQVVAYDLLDSKMLRAIESTHQLAEEMDDFWFNHFNVFYEKGADRFLIPQYEREAIRPHVLGQFRDLLEATAKSPAMLFFLDNFESVRPDIDANDKNRKVKRGLNENYGRELMELHTLGVNGGYTQKDVTEVARCFTGWGIQEPRKGGGFFFNDKLHDKGEKMVLGHVIAAGGGIEDGEQVLDILARHPSTAHFISKEIAQRFVADNPPEALVHKMAQTFLATNGSIREVMKTMLNSKEFWSEGAYRSKIKSPLEMVASSARALDAHVIDGWALANQVGTLGEPLYRKLEPTGYSNLSSDWINSAALLGRMNFALQLAQNHVESVKVDVSRFGDDPSAVAKILMFRAMSPQTRTAIEKALEDDQKTNKQKNPAMVAALVIGSPDFQKR